MLLLRLSHLSTQQGLSVRAVSGRELTSAILLIIKVVLFEQLITTFLQATLAPVLCPEHRSGHFGHCFLSCPFYLFQTLPATGGQRGGEIAEAQLLSLTSRLGESQRETLFTAKSPFGLVLQPADVTTPCFVVVVAVNPTDAQTLGMTFALVFSNLVLLTRPDIRVIIEYGGAHAIVHQPLNNG